MGTSGAIWIVVIVVDKEEEACADQDDRYKARVATQYGAVGRGSSGNSLIASGRVPKTVRMRRAIIAARLAQSG